MKPLSLIVVLVVESFLAAQEKSRPDIVLADFEGDTYGGWKAEGEAFGTAPARGTLPGQMAVTGFVGKGLVNFFRNGDRATGTLTSPEFAVERKHLNFLIGGGGWKGETCMNLLVDGKVVRTATGPNTAPGGSEALDWASWDVAEFAGKKATLQIVDKSTGGWGHINVDQITQSDTPKQAGPVRREMTIEKRYLHLPVRTGDPKRVMKFAAGGKTVREFEIEFAEKEPAFWVFADVQQFKGKKLTVEAKLTDETALERITQSDTVPDADKLYQEKHRPQFHFTSRRGWLNDPNGLVFHGGEWHLFYQHNPFGWGWGNMHWGHAVSRDLVRWEELPIAIAPPRFGDWAFSGSAVVDEGNTSGWGTKEKPPLVAAWTSTGRGECISYSTDAGRTWTEFDGNPVVKHRGRDPRLLWHAASKQWVMAVYDEEPTPGKKGEVRDVAFYTSPDLKAWTYRSRISGYFECPDLFELPVDGDRTVTKWVLHGADGRYALGTFDGREFRPDGPKRQLWHGRFYAAQTFSNAPGGRRVQIGWANGVTFPGMPFNQQMNLPVELTLRTTPDGVRMFAAPVKELETLRGNRTPIDRPMIRSGDPALTLAKGELAEMRVELDVSQAKGFEFRLRGAPLTWDAAKNELMCGDVAAPLKPIDGKVSLHVFQDRGSVEVFANGGAVAICAKAIPADDQKSVELLVKDGQVLAVKGEVFELTSAWKR